MPIPPLEPQNADGSKNRSKEKKERPISKIYSVIDNDLARDNVENDMAAADLQNL